MKYPIITSKGKPFYPTEKTCPICGTDRTTLGSSFFALSSGALKIVDNNTSLPSEDLSGFLSLTYHAGEKEECVGASIHIVESSQDGQFEIYFCSIECLQTFFNQAIEELKRKTKMK